MTLTITNKFSSFAVSEPKLTSNSEHFEPGPVLKNTNETDNADDSKREHGELLGQFVHAILKGSPPLLDILHHAKDDTKLCLRSSSNRDARTTTWD